MEKKLELRRVCVRSLIASSGATEKVDVSFREYGDVDNGFPIIFAHGNLNSCLFEPCWEHTRRYTIEAGARVIAVDRPGYGDSTIQHGRTYMDWAKDIQGLANELGLKRFGLAGFSSGGVHCLGAAAALGGRVSALALISSDGPYKLLGKKYLKKVYGVEESLTIETALDRSKSVYEKMRESYKSMSKPDRAQVALADLDHAVKQGLLGASQDCVLETNLWDFDLARVEQPLTLWHGREDSDVPVEAGEELFRMLTNSKNKQMRIIDGENHTLIRRHWKPILETLIKQSQESNL